MPKEYILRNTKSICPFCYEVVESKIIEKNGEIFLNKFCPQHSSVRILLANKNSYYKNLNKFYFSIMSSTKRLQELSLYVTFRCNMHCPICYLGSLDQKEKELEPTLSEIEEFAKSSRYSAFIITGGEPTCRDDLAELIRILKKYSKAVSINTNGIKIANIDYLRKLKKAGLDRINIQLDSFCSSVESQLRGKDYLSTKQISLGNLEKTNIATGINTVVVKGLNDGMLKNLIDFASKNRFIKTINFLTIILIGGAVNLPLEKYIMPDELIDLISQQTKEKLSKHSIYLFQKLHLAIKSFFSQRFCLYSQVYVAVRTKEGYEPIDNFLNLDRAEKWLNRYQGVCQKNKYLSALFLIIAILTLFIKFRSVFIIIELFRGGFSYFLKSDYYLKSGKFFYINFTTACDPYKIDYEITKNCHNELLCMDTGERKFNYKNYSAAFYIDREKQRFMNRER